VRTSGMLPGFVLRPGEPINAPTTIYSAAQPSIIRKALATIPDRQYCHFLDLGCGKGRPLLIATEFGFAAITGVELSPTLSRIARRNASVFFHAHPDRPGISIVTGDALAHKLPQEKLVVFLYNPFGRALIAQLLSNIESSLQAISRELYIVYYNPTWADALDASTALERRYAAQLPYDPSEIGFGPDEADAVVVWQNRGNPRPRPPGIPAAPVTIVSPAWRAEIASIDAP
jgi:SAM-dependent methyltransferase